MSQRIFTDRSRIETAQHCLRERFLRYHQDGTGLESAKKALPLAIGGAVHKGLEVLLRWASTMPKPLESLHPEFMAMEQTAVDAAIADLSQYRNSLALDSTEAVAQATAVAIPDDEMRKQLADSLGLSVEDAGLDSLLTTQASGKAGFEDYLWKEQSSLVEGIVRAYARRRLRPLLEEFEVLEVEREGTWTLASVVSPHGCDCGANRRGDEFHQKECAAWDQGGTEIVFCSRPDALLRSRSDNSLYLMSFKTAATWDRRKELDAQHDMQGLSEGVEVERRLGEWWAQLKDAALSGSTVTYGIAPAMVAYLRSLPAPPRILGIRYEYMLKFYRGEDKALSQKYGFKVWSQRSPLVRAYRNHKTGEINASWDFVKDDGAVSKLAWQNWKSEPVWDLGMTVKQWIDKLDASEETMSAWDSTTGLEPRPVGWKSQAQATGFLARHPLDEIFIAPIISYRSDDDLRDWIESTEAQEVRVAESVAQIEAAENDGERRSLLNRLMPMSRRSCSYPVECPFAATVCYASADAKANPLGIGKFVRRTPNHLIEKEALCLAVNLQANTEPGRE